MANLSPSSLQNNFPSNPFVCGGCKLQMTEEMWGSQCRTCNKYLCGLCDCGCLSTVLFGDELQVPAERAISKFMLHNRDFLNLSFQGFTVEDTTGCLEYFSGEKTLQSLFEIPPVLGCAIANELPEPMREAYEDRQLGAWLNRFTPGELFDLNNEWKACVIPLLFNEQRFTVSLFFTA
jgi:hypothetical protein